MLKSHENSKSMNKTLQKAVAIALTFIPMLCLAQAPLGSTADFVLFSTNGAVSNTGLSHLTGNVGTNNGSSTNFGNVDGVMHDSDGTTAIAAADLTIAYNFLDAAIPGFFPASLLGNGQVLNAGTYSIGQSATLDNVLTLDAQGNTGAVFIIQIEGAFASTAGSQVLLANGAQACNVFWKIEGLVNLATNTSIKGTIIANNAAIILNTGVNLEGRALSTTGAVTIAGATARKPVGCGSAQLEGPAAPALLTVACYTIFSGNGGVTNTGVSFVTGDVGTNVGLTTGFQASNVTGTIHANPDTSTAQCAADLGTVYTYLNTLPTDIQLLFPASFGNDLVLTPHTYSLNAATVLTGTVTFNAQGNEDAVFVIKINGALSTGTYATVALANGAQAKNIFWKVDGATNLNDYAEFKGTIIGNNGAVILNTGVNLQGRVLSTNGAVSTFGINAQMTPGCTNLGLPGYQSPVAKLYPNPFSGSFTIAVDNGFQENGSQLVIFNTLGAMVYEKQLSGSTNSVNLDLPSGVYLYKLSSDSGKVHSGKLVSKQ